MMRLRVFLAALLFAAAGLPDPVLGQAATPSRYMHPKGKFAILVPAGAEAVERDDGISLSIQSRKGYLINIQMGDANPSLDLSRMAVKLEAQYLGANKTWNRKLGERVITVGGLKAIDGTYEGERTRTRVIIARGRKTDFVIMFFAPPSKFDALVGEFDGILGTLAPGADEVVAAATAPRSESPPPPSPATKDPLQRYSDNDFRYAITYPADWTFAKSSPFTVLFTGRRGTPAFDATVSVQTIRPPGTRAAGQDLAADLLSDLKTQLARGTQDLDYFGEGRFIYERGELRLSGYEFLVTYTRGPRRHRQWSVIIPRPSGDVAHVWSYIAPLSHFDAFRPVAEAMQRSWEIFPDTQ